MRFHHLDLNLLVALDILLEEQNITRAAERLHMTQSATSGVLKRLRKYFEDDLLVQVGRTMQPTPYALELAGPVRDVLLTIRSSITAKPAFNPAASKRHFQIAASDYLISVLFARFLQHMYQIAPGITFELHPPGALAIEMILRGEIDLIFFPDRYIIEDHPASLLFTEQHVCVVWRDNPEVGESLTLEQYSQMGHISVGFGRTRQLSIEDWFMNQYGLKRRLEVVTTDFNTLPQFLVGTHRIATMPRRLAEHYIRYLPLRILQPPVEIPVIHEYMQWHKSMDADSMHCWLREQILEFIQSTDKQLIEVAPDTIVSS